MSLINTRCSTPNSYRVGQTRDQYQDAGYNMNCMASIALQIFEVFQGSNISAVLSKKWQVCDLNLPASNMTTLDWIENFFSSRELNNDERAKKTKELALQGKFIESKGVFAAIEGAVFSPKIGVVDDLIPHNIKAAEELANSIKGQDNRENALVRVARALASVDSVHAEELSKSFNNSYYRWLGLTKVAKVKGDPNLMKAYVNEFIRPLQNVERRDEELNDLIHATSGNKWPWNIALLEKLAHSIQDKGKRESALTEFVRILTAQKEKLPEAEKLAQSIESLILRERALGVVIRARLEHKEEIGHTKKLVSSIQNPYQYHHFHKMVQAAESEVQVVF